MLELKNIACMAIVIRIITDDIIQMELSFNCELINVFIN